MGVICPATVPSPELVAAAAAVVVAGLAVAAAAAETATTAANLGIYLATALSRDKVEVAAVGAVGRPPNATNAKDMATSLVTAPRNTINLSQVHLQMGRTPPLLLIVNQVAILYRVPLSIAAFLLFCDEIFALVLNNFWHMMI